MWVIGLSQERVVEELRIDEFRMDLPSFVRSAAVENMPPYLEIFNPARPKSERNVESTYGLESPVVTFHHESRSFSGMMAFSLLSGASSVVRSIESGRSSEDSRDFSNECPVIPSSA